MRGSHLDFPFVVCCSELDPSPALQADVVAHRLAHALPPLCRHPLGHGDGSQASGLRAEDPARLVVPTALVQQKLWDLERTQTTTWAPGASLPVLSVPSHSRCHTRLCGFPWARLSHHQHHSVLLDELDDLRLPLGDREGAPEAVQLGRTSLLRHHGDAVVEAPAGPVAVVCGMETCISFNPNMHCKGNQNQTPAWPKTSLLWLIYSSIYSSWGCIIYSYDLWYLRNTTCYGIIICCTMINKHGWIKSRLKLAAVRAPTHQTLHPWTCPFFCPASGPHAPYWETTAAGCGWNTGSWGREWGSWTPEVCPNHPSSSGWGSGSVPSWNRGVLSLTHLLNSLRCKAKESQNVPLNSGH